MDMDNELDARKYGLDINDMLPILNSIGQAIFIDDAEGYALWINKACEEIYRINKEDVIGKHCTYLEHMGIFAPSVARRVLEEKREVTILHKNKDGKQLLSTGMPIWNEKGELSKIVSTSHDVTELMELQNKLESIQSALQDMWTGEVHKYEGIIANSPSMLGVIQMAERLASLDTTVLITGESGSGKGVIAKLIHEIGDRRDQPFIQINCGAIPANLLETELFGYERGAFTGSRKEGKKGLFEAARNGTVFLDEISELPLNLQVKILQVIQEKAVQRVGGLESIPVDVRIISATNRNLEEMVKEGRFREDLFYRLNVVPIAIPALRDRPEDIVPMIRAFLHKNNEKFNEHKTMNTAAMSILLKYRWPGNVRELENIIERLVITTKGSIIGPENLPSYIFENARSPGEISISQCTSLQDTLDAVEKQILSDALAEYKTTREIARALGISQPTVVRKLAKHGL
ncbi:MAG: sigma 54-interacting transcriptional regulator [Bacillota bacterium]|jgi:PAS domain S-box-containing protein|nr:sigma 54-interacting transcriptional regulator [Bacillota bacterium]NLM08788.1 sigma 54-interacting transcriptional regulator [Clostridiales Family XIII bacterium]